MGVHGLLIGAVSGLVFGLLARDKLKAPIKNKLFSQHLKLNDSELRQSLQTIRTETGIQKKSDAIYLLSMARAEYLKNPNKYQTALPAPMSLKAASIQILNQRS